MKFPPSYAGLASNSSRPEYLATGMSDYNVREKVETKTTEKDRTIPGPPPCQIPWGQQIVLG